jgi:hypothetical protein
VGGGRVVARLSLDIASRDLACRAPWHDQPRARASKADNSGKYDRYGEGRYGAAIPELRESLADGRWHPKSIAREIARRHKCGLVSLCDRAGVYFEGEECIWVNA